VGGAPRPAAPSPGEKVYQTTRSRTRRAARAIHVLLPTPFSTTSAPRREVHDWQCTGTPVVEVVGHRVRRPAPDSGGRPRPLLTPSASRPPEEDGVCLRTPPARKQTDAGTERRGTPWRRGRWKTFSLAPIPGTFPQALFQGAKPRRRGEEGREGAVRKVTSLTGPGTFTSRLPSHGSSLSAYPKSWKYRSTARNSLPKRSIRSRLRKGNPLRTGVQECTDVPLGN